MKRLRYLPALSLLALIVAAFVVGGMAPASAHTGLVSTDPRDGADLAAPPSQVTFVFDEDLLPDFVDFSISNGDGEPLSIAGVKVDGSTAALPWPSDAPGNTYTVAYRVVSQDGHPVSGAITFSYVRESPSPTPTSASASPTPTSDSSSAAPSSSTSPEPEPTQTTSPEPTNSSGSASPTQSPDTNPVSSASSTGWIIAGIAIVVLALIAIIALVARRR